MTSRASKRLWRRKDANAALTSTNCAGDSPARFCLANISATPVQRMQRKHSSGGSQANACKNLRGHGAISVAKTIISKRIDGYEHGAREGRRCSVKRGACARGAIVSMNKHCHRENGARAIIAPLASGDMVARQRQRTVNCVRAALPRSFHTTACHIKPPVCATSGLCPARLRAYPAIARSHNGHLAAARGLRLRAGAASVNNESYQITRTLCAALFCNRHRTALAARAAHIANVSTLA